MATKKAAKKPAAKKAAKKVAKKPAAKKAAKKVAKKAAKKPAGKAALDGLVAELSKVNVETIIAVGHTDATGTGAARALLDQQQLDAALPEGDDAGEAVLYGRISGTIVVRRVP